MQRISVRASNLSGDIDGSAQKDVSKVWVSALVFWPAASFVKGDSYDAAEYSRLKGEYDAMEQAAISKRCGSAEG